MRRRGDRTTTLLLALLAGCQVPTDILYERTYFCDGTAQADTCGTTREGAPMTCYMARQVGARDMCTERCLEENASASGPGWRCVDTRARLRTCRPSEGPQACRQPETNCLRTDALDDEGVCMSMDTCTEDRDCRDPTRPSCMSSLVKTFYGAGPGILVDHFSCLRIGCRKDLAACGPGESCLPNVIPAGSNPPDICVPNCDRDLNCPPNYFCLRKVSGEAAAAVCIPGILGFRCITDMDCLIGDCRDTGDGFNLCAAPCQTHEDCARYGSARGPFMCATDVKGRGRFCQNPLAFAGSICAKDEHCRPHERCMLQSPYFGSLMSQGECRARCGPDQPCVDRGGVPHVCVEITAGGGQTCYPGQLHLPCAEDGDCVGDLKCLEVSALDEPDRIVRRRRCSLPCRTDDDCNANRFAAKISHCHEGACVARRHDGFLCQADTECLNSCKPSQRSAEEAAMGVKRCAK